MLPICCENSTHLEANHAFWQILGLYFLLPELSLLMNYFSAARVRDFELFWSDYFFSNQNYSYKMISIGNCTFMDFQPKMVEFFKTNFTLNFRSQISYLSAIRLFKGNGGSIKYGRKHKSSFILPSHQYTTFHGTFIHSYFQDL